MKRIAFILSLAGAGLLLAGCASQEAKDKQMMAGPSAMPAKYVGYLMDTACGSTGKGADGSNVALAAQDHTQDCLVACEASGFGISVKDGMAYKYIPFDKAGSDLANRTILQKTTRTKGVSIEVEGTLAGGVLTVKSIKESGGMM